MNWTPHHVRGDTKCSFFSAARRTNQEAPPLLSGYLVRRLAPPSGLRNSLRSDSPRPLSFSGLPTPCPIKAGFCGSSIFSPHSALSGIFLSAFSHRPDGFALRSCRALMRHPGIPASLPVRFTFLDPASLCGVTQRKCRRCYRAEVARAAPSSGAAELATLKQSSPSFLLRLARSLPDKGGILATLLFLP